MNAICQQRGDIRCSSLLTGTQHSLHVPTSTLTKRHDIDHRNLDCFGIRPAVNITLAVVLTIIIDNQPPIHLSTPFVIPSTHLPYPPFHTSTSTSTSSASSSPFPTLRTFFGEANPIPRPRTIIIVITIPIQLRTSRTPTITPVITLRTLNRRRTHSHDQRAGVF